MPRTRAKQLATPAAGPPRYRAQLATLVKAAPSGEDWLHELKYDGYRLGCSKNGPVVRLESRRGNDCKILIDYKRNHRAAVAVVAYSTRARPDGSVSVPMSWDEVATADRADGTSVLDLREKLAARSSDPWRDYWACRQRLPGSRIAARRSPAIKARRS